MYDKAWNKQKILYVCFIFKIITILHWLPVKTRKSGVRVTVWGGNEALPLCQFCTPDFTVLTGRQCMIVFLAYHMKLYWLLSKNVNVNTALSLFLIVAYEFTTSFKMAEWHDVIQSTRKPCLICKINLYFTCGLQLLYFYLLPHHLWKYCNWWYIFTVGSGQLQIFILISPKLTMDHSKNWR